MKKVAEPFTIISLLVISLLVPVSCNIKSSSSTFVGFMGALKNDSGYSFFAGTINSTNQTKLAPASSVPAAAVWSPDGTQLAYLDRDNSTRTFQFFTVKVDGSNVRKVTDLTEFLPMSWAWAADGKSIVMLCSSGGQAEPKPGGGIDERHYVDIFSLNLKTGEMKRLTDTKNTGKSSPVGSPDGKKIAFPGNEHDPATWNTTSYGIYVINSDGSGQPRLFDSPYQITSLQWSPDSKEIVYSSYDANKGKKSADIFTLEVATGANINLTNSADTGDFDPFWSPDGRKISFCSGITGQGYQLRVMNPDGTGVTNLFDLADYPEGFPCWSADGKNILFTDRESIYSVNIDGKNLKTLLDGKGIFRDILYPVWLSD